jgi:hypothetical protein
MVTLAISTWKLGRGTKLVSKLLELLDQAHRKSLINLKGLYMYVVGGNSSVTHC